MVKNFQKKKEQLKKIYSEFGERRIKEIRKKIESEKEIIHIEELLNVQEAELFLAKFINFRLKIPYSEFIVKQNKIYFKNQKDPVKYFKFLKKNGIPDSVIQALQNKVQFLKSEKTVVITNRFYEFLCMSEFTNGWKSCHSWDGEYFSGAIAYAMDKKCYLGYVKNKYEEKIFRQIIIDFGDVVLFSRQYPQENLFLSKIIRRLFLTKVKGWINWKYETKTIDNLIPTNDNWPYPDWENHPVFLVFQEKENLEKFLSQNHSVGGEYLYCLDCGEKFHYTDYSDVGKCLDCNIEYYCYKCGERLREDEIYRGADDEIYCGYCWEELFCECVNCGDVLYQDNAVYVDGDGWYCDYCFNANYFYCAKCGEIFPQKDGVVSEIEGEMYCQECYSEKFGYCEICDTEEYWDYLKEINGKCVCRDCYDQCQECKKYILKEDLKIFRLRIGEKEIVRKLCRDCYEEYQGESKEILEKQEVV
ncbi:hypothetical protein DRN73_05270 [Candidatus Pacearchaeota archaeon]|nr:MAG: hypothetical protein DRN73_05270 [Candidatus Pacearchaeota archaeon]